MKAPNYLLEVWKQFDSFPMETLTKAWYYQQGTEKKQRDVSLMKEHRAQYGISGNCFDLAIWLLEEYRKEGIEAYPIGSEIHTSRAHVAVIALDEKGHRYLCDLGDQWIQPILLDSNSENFTSGKLSGFFPGAEVEVNPKEEQVEIVYHRPNGKFSNQLYDLKPIEMKEFMEVAEISQRNIHPKPLVECRIPYKNETAHWEFYDWKSFWSSSEGLVEEETLHTTEEWAKRVSSKTGYDQGIVSQALNIYKGLK